MMDGNVPSNGFRITNRELYDVLLQVRDRVARLESLVDNVLSENVDLRKRVRGLELKFYGILAGLVAATIVLSRVSNLL